MGVLPYRATVFICGGCEPLNLIERDFARETDAVKWCRVMTEAKDFATGQWMVARKAGAREREVTRENGLGTPVAAMEA